MSIVPVIDMRLRNENRAKFARLLGEAFETIGFARLINHPVPLELIQLARHWSAMLYTHSDEILRQWEDLSSGRQVGFTPFRTEQAAGQELKNLMRFWHIRSLRQCTDLGFEPIFPDSLVPKFRPIMLELFALLEEMALNLLGDLDLFLGDDSPGLRDMAVGGASLLRNIHYPIVGDRGADGSMRSFWHEDINFITLLIAATRPGLFVIGRDGNEYAVNEEPGEIVVDGGDMLQLATGGHLTKDWKLIGGRFRATTHGVKNPAMLTGVPDEDRISMPFFVHPRPDAPLWVPNRELRPEEAVRQMHFVAKRLMDNGVDDGRLFRSALKRYPITPW